MRNRTLVQAQGLFETMVHGRKERFQAPPEIENYIRVQKRTPQTRSMRDAFALAKLKSEWWEQFSLEKDKEKPAKPAGNKVLRAAERAKKPNKNGKPRNRPYLPKPGRRLKDTKQRTRSLR